MHARTMELKVRRGALLAAALLAAVSLAGGCSSKASGAPKVDSTAMPDSRPRADMSAPKPDMKRPDVAAKPDHASASLDMKLSVPDSRASVDMGAVKSVDGASGVCGTISATCSLPTDCCAGLDCQFGACCAPLAATCTAPSDCCDVGASCNGVCCMLSGIACAHNTDCCSGTCNSSTSKCM